MRTSILDGVSVVTLQIQLSKLQQAYLDLSSGTKVEVAEYAQGEGNKKVTFTRARIGDLTQAILALQSQIDTLSGIRTNRRPAIRPFF